MKWGRDLSLIVLRLPASEETITMADRYFLFKNLGIKICVKRLTAVQLILISFIISSYLS